MKKSYKKPAIFVEEFSPQQVLCACAVENKTHSEHEQCGYYLEGLGYYVFAQSWTSCQALGDRFGYCYQPGTTTETVFSS